jgi:guanine deaminase
MSTPLEVEPLQEVPIPPKRLKGFRAEILHFHRSPFEVIEVIGHLRPVVEEDMKGVVEHFPDGLLVVDLATGKVVALGHYAELSSAVSKIIDAEIVHYPHGLLVPGFIDCHIHYPQTELIASFGTQLLEWLERYTFPTEAEFKDEKKATSVAQLFLRTLLAAGTTTALVFGTVHKQSVDSFFTEANNLRLRMICGKVLMNRNCPEYLQDPSVEQGENETRELIEKWHKKDRLLYAVTPRFAPTSTLDQLQSCGKLLKQYDGLYLHTHLSENRSECEWVKSLYKMGYVQVYHETGLLGPRSVFAHSIHLESEEITKLSVTKSCVAHCPTSNTFLGSGLCDVKGLTTAGIRLGFGTDVGGGTSFCQLQTMFESYKVGQMRGTSIHPLLSFYFATLGGAKALSLDHVIGNFNVGKEADFIVLDLEATELLQRRLQHGRKVNQTRFQLLVDKLFALIVLGDDRMVQDTYILGQKVAGVKKRNSRL